MLEFSVEPSPEWDRVIDGMLSYDRLANRHLERAMSKSVKTIEGGARKTWPVGISGRSRNSLASTVFYEASDLVGVVGSTLGSEIYPKVIETGRKPGSKAPPPGALDRWVELVLKVPANEIRGVAYLIGRKIARRGLVGKFPLRRAYFAARAKISSFFTVALADIVRDLLRGRR